MYVEAAHDEFFARSFTRACIVQFIVALTPHCGERHIGYDGLSKKHVGSIVGTQTCHNKSVYSALSI